MALDTDANGARGRRDRSELTELNVLVLRRAGSRNAVQQRLHQTAAAERAAIPNDRERPPQVSRIALGGVRIGATAIAWSRTYGVMR